MIVGEPHGAEGSTPRPLIQGLVDSFVQYGEHVGDMPCSEVGPRGQGVVVQGAQYALEESEHQDIQWLKEPGAKGWNQKREDVMGQRVSEEISVEVAGGCV